VVALNKEKIARIIYYELIPIIVGFFFFGSLGRVTNTTDLIQKMITFAMYIIPLSFIYVWIGGFIFSRLFPRDTYAYRLMTKMINCKIRKEHGDGYCVKCPDGTVCITSIDGFDKIDKVDKIKGDVIK
jgi:hypothetical protein